MTNFALSAYACVSLTVQNFSQNWITIFFCQTLEARKHQIWHCRIIRRNLQFEFGGVAVKVVFVSIFRYIGRLENI